MQRMEEEEEGGEGEGEEDRLEMQQNIFPRWWTRGVAGVAGRQRESWSTWQLWELQNPVLSFPDIPTESDKAKKSLQALKISGGTTVESLTCFSQPQSSI